MYVSEVNNHCLNINFDISGCFVHCFGKRGAGEEEFDSQHSITTDSLSNLYIC